MKNLRKLLSIFTALLISALFMSPAFAVRTTVTPQSPVNIYGTISANSADITWVALDPSNGNRFVPSGCDALLFYNSSADTAYTATITSAPIKGRTLDVTYTLQAGEVAFFGPYPLTGWQQAADRYFYITGNNAAVKVAVLRIRKR